jgi:amidase
MGYVRLGDRSRPAGTASVGIGPSVQTLAQGAIVLAARTRPRHGAALLIVGLFVLALMAGRASAMSVQPDPTPPAPVLAGVDLERATIPDIQRAFRRDRLSSSRLTRFYINRIWRVDPLLRSVVTVNPDALAQATQADRRRRSGRSRGLVDGIPILLKDNIDTADDQPTTAGSLALLQSMPQQDAEVVARLRRRGAVILGKANLSEWANFRDNEGGQYSGWSAVRGQNTNPYVLDRNPCGSSSGPAAAVAAGLATAAVGTETWGSIMCPAGANGVVGVKPTVGLVSRAGIIPISAAQDTAGPFARNVTDAAIMLGAMQGTDPRDAATSDAAPYVARDYPRVLDADALDGKRIGLWRSGEGPEVMRILDEAAAAIRGAGATVVDVELDPSPLFEPAFRSMLVEFKHGINAYLAQTPGPHPRTLAELMDFNARHAALEMPLFGQDLFEAAQATTGVTDPAYREDRRFATETARQVVDDTLRNLDLDAFVAPANGPAWVTNGQTTTCTGSGDASTFPAIAGYPNVAVPAGFACGELPVGVGFFAGRFQEPTVLALAYAFEQKTRARRPPKFLPTLAATEAVAASTRRRATPPQSPSR